ncbi:ATP-binding protein [Nocardiopsis dassonvillei]|uniref:ATP-binding protein n=1 Tax=Nocardiopsis dassonvillei TaxID=2014 RepID=UPI000B9D5824|nr:BTAD domain-containing putative transcriptional regulator [Nocardiopsis dassonvillei]ASU58885.1 AfsR family transcriptional regulator [Nocardiopsis dassonvillei]
MRFGVLGPLTVRTDDGEPVRIRDTKVRALLASLLLARGRLVPADRLVRDLWDDTPPARPAAVLQARVSQLRGDLERAEPGARALVRHRAPGYLLDADDVDAARFEELLRRAARAEEPRERADLLTRALDLWRGPVLAEFADTEPARSAAAHWEELRATALEDRAEARLELGEHAALAVELAEAAARHPYRERLHAARVRALYGAGRQGEALAAYEGLRARLAEEMGIDPGPELTALHRAVLTQDPSLDPAPHPAPPQGAAAFPAAHRTAVPAAGLPAPVGDLIGRDDHLRALRSLIGAQRMVTLTGPGGVGKTRLALAAARALDPGTALFVELAALAPGGDPVPLLAAALGVRDDASEPGAAPHERVAGLLRGRDALLVLDNCEHVVGPVADTVARLLGSVPDLRVLATSQVPLDVAGEHLYALPPLDLPDPDTDDPEALAASGAVRLFTARARAAAASFALDTDTAPAVAAVCRRLDGIPLALELAAIRLRHMGVADLAARLDDRFALLGTGRRDAPARQRTLRAVIDWSWEPLSAAERAVLGRLAVHADGCDLAAAEAVCADSGAVPAHEVLGLVGALVDRSLVVAADRSGATRYLLRESVAAYALERLEEAGDARRTRARHAAHFADLAEYADAGLRGADQEHRLRCLDRESANLDTALAFAVKEEDARLALRLAESACWYRYLRGRAGAARAALDDALSVPGAPPGARARARVWRAALAVPGSEDARRWSATVEEDLARVDDPVTRARLTWFTEFTRWGLGDPVRAAARVERARDACVRAGDTWGAAVARETLARAAFARGDLAGARREALEAERALRALGDRWGILRASDTLAQIAEARGDLAETARRHEEGLHIAEGLRLWHTFSLKLSGLGRVALLGGDLDRADVLHARALRVAEEHADPVGEQFADAGIALAARRRGDLDLAERSLLYRLEWNRRVDGRIGTAFILTQLGFVAEQRGDADAALELHGRARREAERSGDPRAVALAMEGLAGAHALAGGHGRATRLLERAAALREEAGAPLAAVERWDVDRITGRIGAGGARREATGTAIGDAP